MNDHYNATGLHPYAVPTPLLLALDDIRRKLTRQSMRFLGDSGHKPPVHSRDRSRDHDSSPPAGSFSSQRRRTRSVRRKSHCPGRLSGAWSGKTSCKAQADVCCIRVRSPSVNILLQGATAKTESRTLSLGGRNTSSKMLITIQGGSRTGQRGPNTTEIITAGADGSVSASIPQQPQEVTADVAARGTISTAPPLPSKQRQESLQSYLRRKVSVILQQVALTIAQHGNEQESEPRQSDPNPEQALSDQVARVALYTAACRQLKHALNLYILAGQACKRTRRGHTRYLRLECSQPSQMSGPQEALGSPINAPGTTLDTTAEGEAEILPTADAPPGPPLTTELATFSRSRPRHIMDLPKGVLLRIFSYLDQRALSLQVVPVCRAWRRLARNRIFWRELTFDGTRTICSAGSICSLLRVTPGLWTLELIGCRDVDAVLSQVYLSCRKLRTLVLDSCSLSPRPLTGLSSLQLTSTPEDLREERGEDQQGEVKDGEVQDDEAQDDEAHDGESPDGEVQESEPQVAEGEGGGWHADGVLAAVLARCACLQYLIVAFTPHLYTNNFFTLLGRRCWDMQCFLVSADKDDVREFCDALSAETPGFSGGEVLLGAAGGTWTGRAPSAVANASSGCHSAHPARESPRLRRRVVTVHTRNNLLRVLALRPDSELRLLQWRMGENHATLDYFGVEVRLNFLTDNSNDNNNGLR